MSATKRLLMVVGATASGKTERAIALARRYGTEIVSCDSRQFYKELDIGVARPSREELASAPHHFVACRSVSEPYNVYGYAEEALPVVNGLMATHDVVVAVGGSGLYVEALCNGIAVLPDPAPGLREQLQRRLRDEGLESLQRQLREVDPASYDCIDLRNPVRVQRALEVSLTAGRPYSAVLAEQEPRRRPFEVEYVWVARDADELRRRIDARVDAMMAAGLADEALSLWPRRELVALQTVGYREFYAYASPDEAMAHLDDIAAQIKLSTWHYAKKQLTWLRKKVGNDAKG